MIKFGSNRSGIIGVGGDVSVDIAISGVEIVALEQRPHEFVVSGGFLRYLGIVAARVRRDEWGIGRVSAGIGIEAEAR